MSDSVGQYLNEIGMVDLLDAQQERELSKLIEAGAEAQAKKTKAKQEKTLIEPSVKPLKQKIVLSVPTFALW